MAQQYTFKQPGRRREDDEDPFADDQGWSPQQRPSFDHTSQVSSNASNTLDNIDSALADHEAQASGAGTGGSSATGPGGADSAADLKNAEQGPPDRDTQTPLDTLNERLGRGYTGKGTLKSNFWSKLYSSNSGFKKKIAIAGAAAGGSVIAGIFAFTALLPLKIVHIVNNLENHFSAGQQDALNHESQSLINSYLKDYIMPSLTKPGCSRTEISYNCVDLSGCPVTNIVCKGFHTWHQNRMEQKLATKYGFEFGFKDKHYYFKFPGSPTNGVDVTDIANDKTGTKSIFNEPKLTKYEAGLQLQAQYEDMTKSQKLWWRFWYGHYVSTKFAGLKRCALICKVHNKLSNSPLNLKKTFQALLLKYVIGPRLDATAEAMGCLWDPNCTPNDPAPGSDGSQAAGDGTNGELQTVGGKDLQTTIANSEAAATAKTIDQVIADELDKVNKAGSFKQYAFDTLLEKMGIKGALKQAIGKAIPIVGLVNTILQLTSTIGHLYEKMKVYLVGLKIFQMVGSANLAESAAAEVTTGAVTNGPDLTALGSFAEALSPTTGADESGASVFKYYVSDETNVQPTVDPLYNLNSDTGATNVAKGLSSSIPGPVVAVADFWNATAGAAFGSVGNALSTAACAVPGVAQICSGLSSLLGSAIQPLMSWLADKMFPALIEVGADGAHTVVAIIGGFDYMINDAAHHTLGLELMTPTQTAQVENAQMEQQKTQFESMSTFARIFDTGSSYSLVSRMAIAMPVSITAATNQGMSSILSNPLAVFAGTFSSIFTHTGSAFAATGAYADPYSIGQYGCPISDPKCAQFFAEDQSKDTSLAQCSDTSANGPIAHWNQSATVDPTTGQPENHTFEPCLLASGGICAGTGLMDPTCLPQGSQNSDNGSNSGGTTLSTGATPASGNAQAIAQQILANKNIDLTCLASANGSVLKDVQDAAAGNVGTAGVMTDLRVLQLIQAVGQSHKVCVTAIQSNGQGHCNNTPKPACPTDPHYIGKAVDFDAVDGVDNTGRNAPALTIMKIAESTLSGGRFGQLGCGPEPTFPSGWTDFGDTCTHLHVDFVGV